MQAAHLLTQGVKSLCRARYSPYEACFHGSASAPEEGSSLLPISAPMHHLQLATPGALGYSWQQLIVEKVRS